MNYHPLPQPEELPKKEKEDAMGAYMMMFAAVAVGLPLPIINLLAAIIYYYVNKSSSRFVRFHSLQSLLSSLPLTIMNGIGLFWSLRILFTDEWSLNNIYLGYIGMLFIVNILYYIMGILAAIKAYKGRMFYYWFFGQMCYHIAFQIKENDSDESPVILNRPPNQLQ